jgi:hypothetical protein
VQDGLCLWKVIFGKHNLGNLISGNLIFARRQRNFANGWQVGTQAVSHVGSQADSTGSHAGTTGSQAGAGASHGVTHSSQPPQAGLHALKRALKHARRARNLLRNSANGRQVGAQQVSQPVSQVGSQAGATGSHAAAMGSQAATAGSQAVGAHGEQGLATKPMRWKRPALATDVETARTIAAVNTEKTRRFISESPFIRFWVIWVTFLGEIAKLTFHGIVIDTIVCIF